MKRIDQCEAEPDSFYEVWKRPRVLNLIPIPERPNQNPPISDSESSEGIIENEKYHLNVTDLIRVEERDQLYSLIKSKFVSCSEYNKSEIEVVAIHKNSFSSSISKARLQSFRYFSKAIQMKRCGNYNSCSYAWFATPKFSISQIIMHGFSRYQENFNSGLYGCGVYLSPDSSAIQSVNNVTEDEDGLKHIFLCRVLLGNLELVRPGCVQCHPSSDNTDSGVDDMMLPTKYIIWSTNKSTHILPEYVLSLRQYKQSSPPKVEDAIHTLIEMNKSIPTSPWIPLTRLTGALSIFLPKHSMEMIDKYAKDHHENKISRPVLVQLLRFVAGDHLLACIIKVFTSGCLQPEDYKNLQIKNIYNTPK